MGEQDLTEIVSGAFDAHCIGISAVARASAGAVTDSAQTEWRPEGLTAED